MTRLGDGNLLARVFGTIHGWLSRRRSRPHPDRRPKVVAHRGAARVAPENTIEAFRKAADLGADAIETDICATRDGHFILWHDADPDGPVALIRQTTGEGMGLLGSPCYADIGSPFRKKPCELTLEEVRAHYGYVCTPGRDGGRPEVPVAVLDELLDFLATEPRIREVFLDMKIHADEPHRLAPLYEKLLAHAARGPGARFNLLLPHRELVEAALEEHRAHGRPERIRVWGDYEWPGALRSSARLGIRNVSMGKGQRAWADLRQELDRVVAARERGRLEAVLVWTIDDEEQLRELARLGVDGIVTNDIDAARRAASSAGAAA